MNDYFWLLLVFPLAWPFVAKLLFRTTLNWQETFLAMAIVAALVGLTWHVGKSSKSAAVEIWNGEVTEKIKDRVSCKHSYTCNCRTSTDANGNTSVSCDTCYEHSHDYDWIVRGNVGKVEIDRIDRQGSRTPPRWSAVTIGEPMSTEHDYDNWVRAVDSSLFHADPLLAARYEGKLPAYPGRIYDYYKIDRLVADGVTIMDAAAWNSDLSHALIDLGPRKQANAIIVITKDASPDYADALRAHWQGANKNDVVTVIGAPEFPKIAWARAFSWTKDETVNIEIRNRLQEMGLVDRQKVMAIVTDEISTHFVRRSFKEFEYLKDEIEPPLWAVILALMVAIPGSFAMTWYFHRHEVDFLNRGASPSTNTSTAAHFLRRVRIRQFNR